MNAVELHVPPLLLLARGDPVLLKEGYYLGPRRQFFFVQALPSPLSINHRVAEIPLVRSVNASTVIKILIFVRVAFRAGLQRGVHRPVILTVMLRMTSDAGDARLRVRACNSRRESFRLMAGRAVGIHLFPVLNT